MSCFHIMGHICGTWHIDNVTPLTVMAVSALSMLQPFCSKCSRMCSVFARWRHAQLIVYKTANREKSGVYAVASLPALGPWAPPAERGPSLESICRVSLTVDLCERNKISFLKFISPQPVGAPQKENTRGPRHVPGVH